MLLGDVGRGRHRAVARNGHLVNGGVIEDASAPSEPAKAPGFVDGDLGEPCQCAPPRRAQVDVLADEQARPGVRAGVLDDRRVGAAAAGHQA